MLAQYCPTDSKLWSKRVYNLQTRDYERLDELQAFSSQKQNHCYVLLKDKKRKREEARELYVMTCFNRSICKIIFLLFLQLFLDFWSCVFLDAEFSKYFKVLTNHMNFLYCSCGYLALSHGLKNESKGFLAQITTQEKQVRKLWRQNCVIKPQTICHKTQ